MITVDWINIAVGIIGTLMIYSISFGVDISIKALLSTFLLKFNDEKQKMMQLVWCDIFFISTILTIFALIFTAPFGLFEAALISLVSSLVGMIIGYKSRNKTIKVKNNKNLLKESDVLRLTLFFRILGNTGWKLIGLISIICWISISVGFSLPKIENKFIQINNRRDVVGVVIYGGKIVCAKLVYGTMLNDFELIEVKDGIKISYKPISKF